MNKIVFAIDVDGVLRNNLGKMVEIYNENFKDNKTVDDITSYKTEVSFPRIEAETGMTASQWFFQEHSKELFVEAEAFEGIADDIRTLQQYGEVVIITYQKSYKNKMEALDWLERHDIDPSGIVFLKDKTLLECDYLIDDNDWNFIGTRAIHGALISAPYNKNTDIKSIIAQTGCDIRRYESFHDFVWQYKFNEDMKYCEMLEASQMLESARKCKNTAKVINFAKSDERAVSGPIKILKNQNRTPYDRHFKDISFEGGKVIKKETEA